MRVEAPIQPCRYQPEMVRQNGRPSDWPKGSLVLALILGLSACVHHEDPPIPEVESGFMEARAIRCDPRVPPGRLQLTVVEHHGFLLPNATVQLWRNAEKVFEGTVDARGAIEVPGLTAGPYTLTILGAAGKKTEEIVWEAGCGASGVIEVIESPPLFLGRLETVTVTPG